MTAYWTLHLSDVTLAHRETWTPLLVTFTGKADADPPDFYSMEALKCFQTACQTSQIVFVVIISSGQNAWKTKQ